MTLSLPTLKQMETAMNQEVEKLGGIDAAIEACDRMYSATFRSEPFPLKSCEVFSDDIDYIQWEFEMALYCRFLGRDVPVCGYEHESMEDDAKAYFNENFSDKAVSGETLVVELCNYKGEGESMVVPLFIVESLPVFKSKAESFNQANNFNNTQG